MEHHSKILFYILILFLSSVTLNSYFQTRQIEPLRGTYREIKRPTFSWTEWFSGEYQVKMDSCTNSKFFIRSILIKIRNQIDFNLFDKVNADVVVKGKDNMLFDKLYLKSFLGQNFLGKEAIDERLFKIKAIQDTLSSLNKQLLVVLGPSKASYFPDYFPMEYDTITKSISNYDYYAQQLEIKNINHLDFNKMFLEKKDTTSHSLYSKLGTHWNNYSRLFVWNTIVKKLEENNGWNLAKLQETKLEMLPSRGRDNDLYHLLNIYKLRDSSQYAYRTYMKDSTNIDKPKGLVIADSYYWGLFTEGFSKDVLGEGMYWYYNNTIHSDNPKVKGRQVKDYDLRSIIHEYDIIILLATAANLHDFPFGFEEDAFQAIQNLSTPEQIRQEQISNMMERIKNIDEWISDLRKKAKGDTQVLDSLLYDQAEYYLKNQGFIE